MVIIELNRKKALRTFTEIKRIITAAKSWKLTTRIEITVLDGKIQLVGHGFVIEVEAVTTGSCKMVIPVMHWFEIIKMSKVKVLKIVITEGEAMIGKVTVNVLTTFFETDRILRSISLAANPKAIDYWKLEYLGYTQEELEFNDLESKILSAKIEFEHCIDLANANLNPFRITREELREIVLQKLREKEKMDFF